MKVSTVLNKSYFAFVTLIVAASFGFGAFAQTPPPITRDATAVQAGTYDVEPTHTRVLFSVSHMGFTTWYGDFTKVSGSLTLDPKKLAASALDVHIKTDSVSTTNEKLDGELRGDQWFDATQFPEIVFKSTKITETGKGVGKVTGDLTFHGITKPVTLDVKFNGAGIDMMDKKYTVGFEVSGRIKRSDFGVKSYVPLIGDDVGLIISAGFERQ